MLTTWMSNSGKKMKKKITKAKLLFTSKNLFPKAKVWCFGLMYMLIYSMGICYLNRHFLMCNLEKLDLLRLLVSGE